MVIGEEEMTISGNKEHALNNVIDHCIGDEVVEVHSYPAGFDSFTAASDLLFKFMALLEIDPE